MWPISSFMQQIFTEATIPGTVLGACDKNEKKKKGKSCPYVAYTAGRGEILKIHIKNKQRKWTNYKKLCVLWKTEKKILQDQRICCGKEGPNLQYSHRFRPHLEGCIWTKIQTKWRSESYGSMGQKWSRQPRKLVYKSQGGCSKELSWQLWLKCTGRWR